MPRLSEVTGGCQGWDPGAVESVGDASGHPDRGDRGAVKSGRVEDDEVPLVAVVVVDEADEPSAVFAMPAGVVWDEGELAGVTAGPEVMAGPVAGAEVVAVYLGPAGASNGPQVARGCVGGVGGAEALGRVVEDDATPRRRHRRSSAAEIGWRSARRPQRRHRGRRRRRRRRGCRLRR